MSQVIFSQGVLDNQKLVLEKCMGEEDAFCVSACPMNTDAKGYVALVAQDQFPEAMALIREQLFLPKTLGRICAHPCEKQCRRHTEFGQAIAIAGIKRYVADHYDDPKLWDLTIAPETGKKVVVVGAGPAGAQAAIDLRKKGHAVTILEKLSGYGGMMRVGIPEYRLPRDILDFEFSLLDKLGVTTQFGVDVGHDVSFEQLVSDYDAVILAHGAHKGNMLSIPGKESEGIYNAVDYLKTISLTKQFPQAGQHILIVGGGDVAMDCARSSWRIGAVSVTQCSLEDDSHLPASVEEIAEAKEEGTLFNPGWSPVAFMSTDGRVSHVQLKKVASIFNAEGKFCPTYTDDELIIDVDTVILSVGQTVVDITGGLLATKPNGRYLVDPVTLQSTRPNVFVAGDASGTNIVVQAMAFGRKAAISVDRLLRGQSLLDDRDLTLEYNPELPAGLTKLNVPLPKGVVDQPRLHPHLRDANERKRDFAECSSGFSAIEVKQESDRCLQCACKLCMSECVMMNDFGTCPKNIFEKYKEMPALLAYSCNACDNCVIVCPHKLPMKKIFIDSRNDFVAANGGESPMPGHKGIKMHQLLGFSKFFTAKKKGDKHHV